MAAVQLGMQHAPYAYVTGTFQAGANGLYENFTKHPSPLRVLAPASAAAVSLLHEHSALQHTASWSSRSALCLRAVRFAAPEQEAQGPAVVTHTCSRAPRSSALQSGMHAGICS